MFIDLPGHSSRVSLRIGVALVALVAGPLRAQDCSDLPKVEPPKLKDCKEDFKAKIGRTLGVGCAADNARMMNQYELQTRGFTSSLTFSSEQDWRLDDSPTAVVRTTLRGCRGEHININVVRDKNVQLQFELLSPSNVVVGRGTVDQEQYRGPTLTLPETGTYTLVARSDAPGVPVEVKDRKGNVRRSMQYPRTYRFDFRSDVSVAAIQAGDPPVTATASRQVPFLRQVEVKGGAKVRFRAASTNGDIAMLVLRESGAEAYRSTSPARFIETPAFSASRDETFQVQVVPAQSESVGITFSLLDDVAIGRSLHVDVPLRAAFKLPAQFDTQRDAESKRVSASETSRLRYRAPAAEALALTVIPSGTSGLVVRVRVYDAATEEILAGQLVSKRATMQLKFPAPGEYVIEVSPVSAQEIGPDGEAKYTVQLTRGTP